MKISEVRELQDILPKYDYTAKLSRDRWAWEFYRRDPEFYEIAQYYHQRDFISSIQGARRLTLLKLRRPQPEAEACGLAFFPNPDASALRANVFWSANSYPRDICVQVVPTAPGVVDELLIQAMKHCEIIHFTGVDGAEQFLLRRDTCTVQISSEGMSLLSHEPHRMRIVLDGHEDMDEKLAILKSAQRLMAGEEDPVPPFTEKSVDFRNALICIDAKVAGLSFWEMAEIIYGADHVRSNKSRGSRSLKDAMRRSLKLGEELRDGGFRRLLVLKSTERQLAA